MARGRFITFEGIDGAGKSSHVNACAQWLRAQRGLEVLLTREPGGTVLGEKLRDLLLHESMHLETETLLMFAARREHLSQVIEPALLRGAWVVCDRFTDATYAYQGGGRGLSAQRIAVLEQWVHAQLQPDLTLVFDVDPQTAWQRMQRAGKTPDRFESEQQQFFSRVRDVYLARAQTFPARLRVVDATQTPAQVEAQLQTYLAALA